MGSFDDDKIEGLGKFTNLHGSVIYSGEVANGLKHGFGTLSEPGGDWYVGNFNNDYKHGDGR